MEKMRRKTYLEGERGTESQSLLLSEEYIQLGHVHPKKREDVSPCTRPRDQTIECDIQPSDTLHSLSLKYNVQLSELKRVNNILQDSEFFALKRIKIPVKTASLLTDILPGIHSEENRRRASNGWYVENKDSPPAFSSSAVSSRLSSGCSSPCSEPETSTEDRRLLLPESKDRKKVKKFLKDMDRDLARIKEKQSDLATSLEPTAVVPPAVRPVAVVTAISSKSLHYSQEDAGCSSGGLCCWCVLVSCVVVALFLILAVLVSIDHHASLFAEEQNMTSHSLAP